MAKLPHKNRLLLFFCYFLEKVETAQKIGSKSVPLTLQSVSVLEVGVLTALIKRTLGLYGLYGNVNACRRAIALEAACGLPTIS
jgi:hypothetical protein